jgi:hypothetical protein
MEMSEITVMELECAVADLTQQLAAKDALLHQAAFVIECCQMHENQYAELLSAIDKEVSQ